MDNFTIAWGWEKSWGNWKFLARVHPGVTQRLLYWIQTPTACPGVGNGSPAVAKFSFLFYLWSLCLLSSLCVQFAGSFTVQGNSHVREDRQMPQAVTLTLSCLWWAHSISKPTPPPRGNRNPLHQAPCRCFIVNTAASKFFLSIPLEKPLLWTGKLCLQQLGVKCPLQWNFSSDTVPSAGKTAIRFPCSFLSPVRTVLN